MFSLSFTTTNAAFQEDEDCPPFYECAEILDQIATLLRFGLDGSQIKDANGNTVGEWSLTESDTP